MTDTYYDREDTPPDLQEQIATLEMALVQADPATAQTLMDDAGAWLGSLYTDAEQRGDGNAMLAVSESWTKLQAIKQQVDVAAATAHAAVAGMRAAAEQRDDALGELAELTEAVESYDTDHPLVADLVEQVEENMGEWVYDDAYENAFEEHRVDMISTLTRNLPGIGRQQADWLISALLTWRSDQITHEEISLLIEFLTLFREALDAKAQS